MKLGVCTSPENVFAAAEAGFDYIECAVNWLARLPETDFAALAASASRFPLPVSKGNCLLPSDVPVTGEHADEQRIRDYLARAFSRAKIIGITQAVFGSGGARRVPEGYPYDKAWRQLARFLLLAGEAGERYGVDVVIEPLRAAECNILNFVSEATILAALTNHSHVGVLGDSYHMLEGGEPLAALTQAGGLLRHVHVSHRNQDGSGRVFPFPGDGSDYAPLFRALRAMGYAGDVSVEAGTKDLLSEGKLAVQRLRQDIAE